MKLLEWDQEHAGKEEIYAAWARDPGPEFPPPPVKPEAPPWDRRVYELYQDALLDANGGPVTWGVVRDVLDARGFTSLDCRTRIGHLIRATDLARRFRKKA